jgi:hypothetical protein
MKLVLLMLFSLNISAQDLSFNEARSLFEEGGRPELENYTSAPLNGRCVYKNELDKKTATALLIDVQDGLFVAPITADKKAHTYFDNLTYAEIYTRHPKVENLFREVFFGESEAILFKKEGSQNFSAHIKESRDYFLMKVFLEEKVFRYCYYFKRILVPRK